MVALSRITKAQNASDWAGGGGGKFVFLAICATFGSAAIRSPWTNVTILESHHSFCWEKALQKFVLRIRPHGAVYSVPLEPGAFHFANTIGEIVFCKLQMYTGSGYRNDIKGLCLGIELLPLP